MSVLNVPKPSWSSEDVEQLADSAQRFFERECLPHYERWERQSCVDRDIWQKAGAAGLLCASVPEEYGGAGGTFAHEATISRAAHLVGVEGFGISLHNAIVVPYVVAFGSEEQKREWLPRLASGELVGAIAMTEPSGGSDLQAVKTMARRDGNHYVLKRPEDLHHQRPARQFHHRRRQDRCIAWGQGHLALWRRNRRARGLPARAQSRQDRPQSQ